MGIFVLNRNGEPLMPTTPARARKMLKNNKAKVINHCPFTIQLTVITKEYKQPVTLGVDSGSKTIGLSAATEIKELYSAEVELRNDIVDLLATRRETRKTRRNRLRYWKPRFLNRVKSKKEGWVAPSINNKIDTHLKAFKDAAFMGIMRWAFYNKLKDVYNNVYLTYGYITKNTRIKNNLAKEHRIDAFCIAGNIHAGLSDTWYKQKKVRCHNQQIHKANILKDGRRKLNQASYMVCGFRLFDKVKYDSNEYFIFERRASLLTERRTALLS